MKKFTILLSLMLLITVISFAQDAKYAKIAGPEFTIQRESGFSIASSKNNNIQRKKSPLRGGIGTVTLGSASNALTTDVNETNCVFADNNLSTVIFIHRNDNTLFENNTSHYRYDISRDTAHTFTLNMGPLNPNCKDSVDWYNSRFPQVSIYNNSGNTISDSAHLVYLGSWHDGTSDNSNAIWNGYIGGVERLDSSTATRTEHDNTVDNGNTLIACSLVQGLPGQFWSVDNEQSGYANDSMIIVYKGVWDNTINDVNWTVYAKLNPKYYVWNINDTFNTYKLSPVIGFDPTGTYGWIGSFADYGTNSTVVNLNPYFFNTTDGGVTWNGPYTLNMSQTPVIKNLISANSSTAIATTYGDIDIAVDKNGTPHLATVVDTTIPAAYGYVPYNGGLARVYDFSYYVSSGSWRVVSIDSVSFIIGIDADMNVSTGSYNQVNRTQVSSSPDGSKIAFLWTDSPIDIGASPDYGNANPDLLGAAYDVDTKLWAPTVDFVLNSNEEAICFTPAVSPISFSNTTSMTVPVVITQFSSSGLSTDPASFLYLQNITFNYSDFTNTLDTTGTTGIAQINKSDNNVKLFPNPADNMLYVSAPATLLNNATVNVYNVLGQLVFTDKIRNNSAYSVNTNSYANGVYTITIGNGNSISSNQFVINH